MLIFIVVRRSDAVFTKSRQSSVNDEIFYICLTFGSILLVMLTGFSWALIILQPYSRLTMGFDNTPALLTINHRL